MCWPCPIAAGTTTKREPEDRDEEPDVDDEDRRPASERKVRADRADHRLQRRPEQDRHEQEQEHAAGGEAQRQESDDDRDADRESRAADGPGRELAAHQGTGVAIGAVVGPGCGGFLPCFGLSWPWPLPPWSPSPRTRTGAHAPASEPPHDDCFQK